MGQSSVDTVAKILSRVDQGAIQIEDQQFQFFNGNGVKNLNHDSSVRDGNRRCTKVGSALARVYGGSQRHFWPVLPKKVPQEVIEML
jgi:hypothetical protein